MSNAFEIILSSAVIVAIINNIVIIINHNKDSRLAYITAERGKWRKDIRDIADQLLSDKTCDILAATTKLKMRINSYSQKSENNYPDEKDLDILEDQHIWKLIDCIESTISVKKEEHVGTDTDLKKIILSLIDCLSLLLKFDWERSKREVTSRRFSVLSMICYVLSIGGYIAVYTYEGIQTSHNSMKLILNSGTLTFWLFAILTMINFLYWLNGYKFWRVRNWYRKNSQLLAYLISSTVFYILLYLVFISYSHFKEIMNIIGFLYTVAFLSSVFFNLADCEMYKKYDRAVMNTLGIDLSEQKKSKKRLNNKIKQ